MKGEKAIENVTHVSPGGRGMSADSLGELGVNPGETNQGPPAGGRFGRQPLRLTLGGFCQGALSSRLLSAR